MRAMLIRLRATGGHSHWQRYSRGVSSDSRGSNSHESVTYGVIPAIPEVVSSLESGLAKKHQSKVRSNQDQIKEKKGRPRRAALLTILPLD
jgi:hypothetical protein